jgi:hypothetical protein
LIYQSTDFSNNNKKELKSLNWKIHKDEGRAKNKLEI